MLFEIEYDGIVVVKSSSNRVIMDLVSLLGTYTQLQPAVVLLTSVI